MSGLATSFSEPAPRWGYFSSPVDGQLCLYGGLTANFSRARHTLASNSRVHVFEPYLESWSERAVSGLPPTGFYNGACASSGRFMYVYGGHNGSSFQSSLHRLDPEALTWTQLSSVGPMKNIGCGIVCRDSKVYVFGGYGAPQSVEEEFFRNEVVMDGDVGWSNVLYCFDLTEKTWSSPAVTGTKPPPCSDFSLTLTDPDHAVLFGGHQCGEGRGRTNDTYILDLRNMHWSKLECPRAREPCPMERSLHAATCLGYGGDRPQLLVTGGRDKFNMILNDVWILDLASGRWREVQEPRLLSRCYHRATAFPLNPHLTEVTLFGGCPEWPKVITGDGSLPRMADTAVLRFEYQQCPSTGGGAPTSEWVLTDLADSSQLGTPQRLRAKMQRMSQVGHTSSPSATCGTAREDSGTRVDGSAELRAREAEFARDEALSRAEQEERRRVEMERRVAEMEISVDRRVREAERARDQALSRAQELESRCAEMERLGQETAWAVRRSEIQVTDEGLGRGSWATVSVATFRGARVAAKVIHNQIVSPHNIRLVKREMDMAARIRHPNLLQFIGATQEGEMVILTELMPTSLRKELERDYFTPRQATAISLDVVRALNYLHQMRPHPLIHRDISSSNILLEPLPNNRWRAKVSDYGTVNLSEKLQTVGPGSPCYAAPEANDPTRQSPKMDIYSFGALLLEMLTGELPAPEERQRLLLKVFHQQLKALIQRCLSVNPDHRPSASDIITELDRTP